VWVVAVGRLFAGIRGAMVIAAGAVRFNLVKFVVADGLAALVSGGMFMAVGHWLGKKIQSVNQIQEWRKSISGYEHWALVGLLVAVVLLAVYVRFRKKKHATLSEAAMSRATDHVAHISHDEQSNP